jgi:hypothetical protein
MRLHFFLSIVFLLSALEAAEEKPTLPEVLVIKDSSAFDAQFKDQVLRKQMSPQVLSKKAESLEQALSLIGKESSIVGPISYMTEYKGWFLFSDGSRSRRSDDKELDVLKVFYSGYAIKKGSDKLVLFGYCW